MPSRPAAEGASAAALRLGQKAAVFAHPLSLDVEAAPSWRPLVMAGPRRAGTRPASRGGGRWDLSSATGKCIDVCLAVLFVHHFIVFHLQVSHSASVGLSAAGPTVSGGVVATSWARTAKAGLAKATYAFEFLLLLAVLCTWTAKSVLSARLTGFVLCMVTVGLDLLVVVMYIVALADYSNLPGWHMFHYVCLSVLLDVVLSGLLIGSSIHHVFVAEGKCC